MDEWVESARKSLKGWKDLAYNASKALQDQYSLEEIMWMPIKGLLFELDYITPHLKEEAKRREQARLEAELQGKRRAGQQRRVGLRHNGQT